MVTGVGYTDRSLSNDEVRALVAQSLAGQELAGKRVLVLIPDGTRSAPIPLFFRCFHEELSGRVAALDYLVALGTHQPMSEAALNRLVGITAEERAAKYAEVRIYNHTWDDPSALATLGVISAEEIAALTGGLMARSVSVTLNRLIFDYDLLIICGPTFPHEVVGFSGGNKYFFPGISGAEVINFTHWLGAVITSNVVIGTQETPVRAVIDRAAGMIDRPKICFSMVVALGGGHGSESASSSGLNGLFVGRPDEAFAAAAQLSSQIHIRWVEKPFRSVLSVMPPMYDDLWTAAKGMYKVEPAVADGGEVVIYAPHLTEISYTHGRAIEQIGYHCRDYFLKQWERFRDVPGGILAHSTHLRGLGTYDERTGEERLRIRVTLATGIQPGLCERVNLGYLDPTTIDMASWEGKEDRGTLVVPRAGELLYRAKE